MSITNYFNSYNYENRTICDVLAEIRKCAKTLNFAPVLSLVEEAQSMANRMEAGLSDKRDIKDMRKERSALKEELKKLRRKVKKLKNQLGESEE